MTDPNHLNGSGSSAILLYENSVLALRRETRSNVRFAGRWGFPGGGKDPDEGFLECAYREVAEEIGLTDISLVLLDVAESEYTPGRRLGRAVGNISLRQFNAVTLGPEEKECTLFDIAILAQVDFIPDQRDYLLANIGRIKEACDSLNDEAIHSTIPRVARV